MTRYKTIAIYAALALAVIAPLVSAYVAHKAQTSYPLIRVDIEPYDPRDLMYGHYMRFAVKWNWNENKETEVQDGEQCLCIGEGAINPPVFPTVCPLPDEQGFSCTAILKGHLTRFPAAPNGEMEYRFIIPNDRYYVDETIARPLEKLFFDKKEEFSVGLSLRPNGTASLEKMYVSGKPLEDYIREHKNDLISK